MTKAEILAAAFVVWNGFFMEVERRFGRSQYGSFLGFLGAKLAGPVILVILKLSSIFRKSPPPTQTPDEGKEKSE